MGKGGLAHNGTRHIFLKVFSVKLMWTWAIILFYPNFVDLLKNLVAPSNCPTLKSQNSKKTNGVWIVHVVYVTEDNNYSNLKQRPNHTKRERNLYDNLRKKAPVKELKSNVNDLFSTVRNNNFLSRGVFALQFQILIEYFLFETIGLTRSKLLENQSLK